MEELKTQKEIAAEKKVEGNKGTETPAGDSQKTGELSKKEVVELKARINENGIIEWSVPINLHKAVYLLKVLEIAINELMKANIEAAGHQHKSRLISPETLRNRTKNFFMKMAGGR